jgi:hypothetical protein
VAQQFSEIDILLGVAVSTSVLKELMARKEVEALFGSKMDWLVSVKAHVEHSCGFTRGE